MTLLKLTQIPHLNIVVIKQESGRFFVAAPDSFIIDKDGFLTLTGKLLEIGFISEDDLARLFKGAR